MPYHTKKKMGHGGEVMREKKLGGGMMMQREKKGMGGRMMYGHGGEVTMEGTQPKYKGTPKCRPN